jgi:putative redox protein
MAIGELAAAGPGASVLVGETGLGRLQMVVRTGHGSFVADEPAAVGGLGSGPNPYDLLAAALGSCTAMTVRLYAERRGWPLERVKVSVAHHRASVEARDLFERTLQLEGPLDEAQRQRLLEIAEKCPVHRTLDRGSDIRTRLDPPLGKALGASSEHLRDMEEVARAGLSKAV